MKAKSKKNLKRITVAFVVTMLGILLALYTDNPFMRLDRDFAEEGAIHGLFHWGVVELSEGERDEILTVCQEWKASWFPLLKDNGVPHFVNEQEQYMQLMFQQQFFLDIFILKDHKIVAELRDWESGRYFRLKNPEILWPVVDLLNAKAAEQRA